MFAPPEAKKQWLLDILAAEKTGAPLSLDYCNQNGGSVWESIVDNGYVHRCQTRGVTVTEAGKRWLKDQYPDLDLDTIQPYNVELEDQKIQRHNLGVNFIGGTIVVVLIGLCLLVIKSMVLC